MAMESKLAENEDFNIGSEEEIKVLDLAKLIFKLCKINKPFKIKHVPGFKYDIKRRVPSSKKARKILGWKQIMTLEEELPKIIKWVKLKV